MPLQYLLKTKLWNRPNGTCVLISATTNRMAALVVLRPKNNLNDLPVQLASSELREQAWLFEVAVKTDSGSLHTIDRAHKSRIIYDGSINPGAQTSVAAVAPHLVQPDSAMRSHLFGCQDDFFSETLDLVAKSEIVKPRLLSRRSQ